VLRARRDAAAPAVEATPAASSPTAARGAGRAPAAATGELGLPGEAKP